MFIPHTDADREAMLNTIGADSLEALFQDVPAAYRFPALNLPPAQTEMEVMMELQRLANANEGISDLICFNQINVLLFIRCI